MKPAIFNEAQKVWKNIMSNGPINNTAIDLELHKKILDLFHVGRYYYYIVDWHKMELAYLSPEIKDILGYPAEDFDAPFLMSLIHPDDQSIYLNNEAAVVDFLQQLPNEKMLKYKMSYDYRIRKSNGEYLRILQQAIALQVDEHNNLLFTLGVHTDISHLKKNNTSVLSFLGIYGEPSYIDVKAAKIYRPTPELFTKREKEIISYVLKGYQSNEIAEILFISKYTVDSHRKNVLNKTNTKNTLEFAIKVISEGLI
ncbi:LuxR C-terminal-related transcriptional regulator [Flavobacterium hauense]